MKFSSFFSLFLTAVPPNNFSLSHAQKQEASRLIFVSVKGAVPRRYEEAFSRSCLFFIFPLFFFSSELLNKQPQPTTLPDPTPPRKKQSRKVAVPVPDGYTWEAFLDQVSQRLKLSGVAALYLSSTGERVTSLDCLQDIDELVAVDADGSSSSAAAAAAARARSGGVAGPSSHHRSSEIGPADSSNGYNNNGGGSAMEVDYYDDEGGDRKYQPRRGVLDRLVGRFFPSSGASLATSSSSGLPLTRQEAEFAGGAGRRGARGRRGGGSKEAAKRSRRQRVCRLFSVLLVLAVAAFLFANFMYGPGGAARLANEVAHEVEGRVGGVMSGRK